MSAFPCTIALSSYSDLLVLERVIRELLQCQGPTCSFLQSAEYKRLKFTITRALTRPNRRCSAEEGGSGGDDDDNDANNDAKKTIHIPHSQLVMYVSRDCTTVLIQSKASVYLEVSAPPRLIAEKRKLYFRDVAQSRSCKSKPAAATEGAASAADDDDNNNDNDDAACCRDDDDANNEEDRLLPKRRR